MLAPMALAASFAAGLPAAAAGHAPQSTPEIRAEAIAQPGVVFLVTKWRGYIRVPGSDWIGPIKATTTCSGFVANPAGYVVTAGHCVDDQSMTEGGKLVLIDALLSKALSRGSITDQEAAALKARIQTVGLVEGKESGSPPDRSVLVFQPATTVSQSLDNGLTAQVVAFKGLSGGDVALLKVQPPSPMAALQVASQAPATGTAIIAAGYPGSVSEVTDTQIQPSFKAGSTSSSRTVSGVPYIEISAASTPGMSGGPTIDMQGRVVGTVSFNPSAEQQSFNFITDTTSVRSMLSQNGVTNKLGVADIAYRAGLKNYWVGHYHAAAAQFGKVVTLDSDQASARKFQSQAVENYPNEVKPKTSSSFPWLWVGIGAAILVVAAGVAALMVTRRRRARPLPSEGRPVPAGGGPAPAAGTGAALTAPPAGTAASGTSAGPPARQQPMETVPPAARPGEQAPWPHAEAPPEPAPAARAEPPAPVAAAEPAGPAATPSPGHNGEAAGPDGEVAGHFCPECGTPHPPDAHFCAACGHRFPAHTGT